MTSSLFSSVALASVVLLPAAWPVAGEPPQGPAPSAAAVADAGDRYTYSGGDFTRVPGDRKWIENGGRFQFSFVEVRRDAEFILLRDATRNLLVRLPTQGGWSAWSNNEGQEWHGLKNVRKEMSGSRKRDVDDVESDPDPSAVSPKAPSLEEASAASAARRIHSMEVQLETQLRALDFYRDTLGETGEQKRRQVRLNIERLRVQIAAATQEAKETGPARK